MRWLSLPLLAVALLSGQASHAKVDGEAAVSKPRTSTMALPAKTNIAWELPAFKLKGLDGKEHSLDEWKGKVIVLNFWASWCGPCQYEIPEFARFQREHGDEDLQIVGMGLDEERKLANVARTLGINYPVLVLDPLNDRKILSDWGNDTGIVPYTAVIDKTGRITYIHRGKMDADVFRDYVFPLLKK